MSNEHRTSKELLPIHCAHGKAAYVKCEQCEEDVKAGKSNGFTPPEVALPAWGMCQLKVANEAYRKKHGYVHEVTCQADKTPTALERFLYEYEDADPKRNEQFLQMLKAVLAEARSTGHEPPPSPKLHEGKGRTGVFTNCGYHGTASGWIIRDGTKWIATLGSEEEATQYVAFRNAPPPGAVNVAPIANIIITNGEFAGITLYAPGLPDGEHDLFCVPLSSPAGKLRPFMQSEPSLVQRTFTPEEARAYRSFINEHFEAPHCQSCDCGSPTQPPNDDLKQAARLLHIARAWFWRASDEADSARVDPLYPARGSRSSKAPLFAEITALLERYPYGGPSETKSELPHDEHCDVNDPIIKGKPCNCRDRVPVEKEESASRVAPSGAQQETRGIHVETRAHPDGSCLIGGQCDHVKETEVRHD